MVEVSANVYDADDYVTQTTDYQYATAASNWYGTTPTARVTQNFYDWRDRLVATKQGAGTSLSEEAGDGVQRPITYYVMDNLGDVTATYVFSGSGVAVSTVAPNYLTDQAPPASSLLRSETTTLYNTWGQVYQTAQVSVTQSGNDAGQTGAAETTNYSHDADGNMISMTDPLESTTTYGYDAFDQQVTVTEPQIQVFNTSTRSWNPVNPETITTYDAAGEVVSVEDPDSNVTSYAYDGIGREASVTGAISSDVTGYAYNPAGDLQSITDPVTTTSYTYDAAGEELTVSQPNPNSPGNYLTTTYGYDADGNVLSVEDPKGYTTSYTYDMLDQLSRRSRRRPAAATR